MTHEGLGPIFWCGVAGIGLSSGKKYLIVSDTQPPCQRSTCSTFSGKRHLIVPDTGRHWVYFEVVDGRYMAVGCQPTTTAASKKAEDHERFLAKGVA